MELIVILHILPVLGKAATITLLAAAGSIGGTIGAAIGALIGTQVDIFNIGGPANALDETRNEWVRLKSILDNNAAVPVGFIFGATANPIDQHQVLAIGYGDPGDGLATLTIWDNNDANRARILVLDFRGSELQVGNCLESETLKCVFVEEYSSHKPPLSLKHT
jgi:hypothetical protein